MEHPRYRVANRHETVDTEKCPNCLNVFQHFADLGDGKFACYSCGAMFLSKPVREYNLSIVFEQLGIQAREKEEAKALKKSQVFKNGYPSLKHGIKDGKDVPSEGWEWICTCARVCKTKAGLKAHQRSCEHFKYTKLGKAGLDNGGDTGME